MKKKIVFVAFQKTLRELWGVVKDLSKTEYQVRELAWTDGDRQILQGAHWADIAILYFGPTPAEEEALSLISRIQEAGAKVILIEPEGKLTGRGDASIIRPFSIEELVQLIEEVSK